MIRTGSRSGPDRRAGPLLAAALALAAFATTATGEALRVGIYDNSPKVHVGADGRPAGMFVELLEAIAAEEGWTLDYRRCAWNDCLQQLERGELDLMPDVAFSDERRRRFDFHRVAVAHSWSTLLVRQDSPLHSLPEFAGARIAILKGAVQDEPLQRMLRGSGLDFTLLPVDRLADGLAAVVAGEADAVVASSYYAGQNATLHGLRETAVVFNPTSLYFAVGRGRHAEVLARIDAHLQAWRGDRDSVYFDALRNAMAPLPPPNRLTPQQSGLLLGLAVLASAMLVMSAFLRWQVRAQTRQLTRTNSQLEHLLGASPVVLYQLRVDGERLWPVWISSNVERVFGFSAAATLAGEVWPRQIHKDDRDRVVQAFATLRERGRLTEEFRLVDGQGRLRHVRDEARWVPAERGGFDEIVGNWSDVTEVREHEARLRHLALHDSLTGLPNRAALSDRLDQAIGEGEPGARFALLLLNVDRLHRVNDGFGHDAGDALLRELARRLKAELRRGETLARLGSDEFAVLLAAGSDADDAVVLATRLLGAIAQPFRHGPNLLTVTACIGISLHPGDGDSPAALLQSADTALTRAKRLGAGSLQFATLQMNEQVQRWVAIEHELRRAIDAGELRLQYQPRVDLADGRLCGAEALLRWHSPVLGEVAPGDFIPVAEDVGLIGAIGEWALRTACEQNRAWQRQGLPRLRVAVNVSASQLRSGDFPQLVARVLAEVGLAPGDLEIELTESVVMHDSESILAQLAELNRIGVSLSLDDFGTGYSSLSYLSRFALDCLKIDQDFVRDIVADGKSAAIANATIGLAHGLGIKVVAEGVEDAAQLRFLREAGCDEMQGYLFSRPLAPDDLGRLLGAGTRLDLSVGPVANPS